MKIGVIGNGVVGSAVSNGLRKIGNEVLIHDLILDTKINNLLNTEIIFICVPTPGNDDGSCNTKIVEGVVKELSDLNYNGIVAIKSTVEPGTTRLFSSKFSKLNLCFVPEFLRERSAEIDFIENHDLCVIGTKDKSTFELIKKAHGNIPKNVHSQSLFLSSNSCANCKFQWKSRSTINYFESGLNYLTKEKSLARGDNSMVGDMITFWKSGRKIKSSNSNGPAPKGLSLYFEIFLSSLYVRLLPLSIKSLNITSGIK